MLGAVVSETPRMVIRYPDERLFGVRAVLPMPGGPQVLDPLARLPEGFQWLVGAVYSWPSQT